MNNNVSIIILLIEKILKNILHTGKYDRQIDVCNAYEVLSMISHPFTLLVFQSLLLA